MKQVTARDIIRMALERTRAIAPGAFIDDAEASSALFELNNVLQSLLVFGPDIFKTQDRLGLLNFSGPTITISDAAAGVWNWVATRIPVAVTSVLYCELGGTEYTALRQIDPADLSTNGFDNAPGTPECYTYSQPCATQNFGLVQLYPAPSHALNYQVVCDVIMDDIGLADYLPVDRQYHEYVVYALAAAISPAYGVDGSDCQRRANIARSQLERKLIKAPKADLQDDDYNIYTNEGG